MFISFIKCLNNHIYEFIKKLSDRNEINFCFIYLPEFWRYELKELNKIHYGQNIYKDKDKGKIISMLKENNINYIDLDEKLFANHDDYRSLFPFRKGGNYNAEGYKQASKIIFETITNNKLSLNYTNSQIIKKQSHFTKSYDAFSENGKSYDK